MPSKNPVVHWEIMGPDAAATVAFYKSLFDWELQGPPGFEEYQMVAEDSMPVGGAVGSGSEEMPSYVTIYVSVDSIDDTLAAVEAAGGSTVTPRTTIPEMVTYALFSDPAGNVVGLVEDMDS